MKILIRSGAEGVWEPVPSAAFRAEADLQSLLGDSPSLVPIQDIREGASPLVVAVREFRLQGSGSTDVVMFSPEGHIAVVECKLANNPEIKRKVIGQIFEYASFLWQLSYRDLDQQVQRIKGKPLAELVGEVADDGWDEEAFRQGVRDSLEQGAFVLVIAVDEITEDLKQTVLYLNGSGSPGYSFAALEMRRFQWEKADILVPHLYGPVPAAKEASSSRGKTHWKADVVRAELERAPADGLNRALLHILDWAVTNGVFAVSPTKDLGIAVNGPVGKLVFGAYPDDEGVLHVFTDPSRYADGVAERDSLVAKLKEHGLVDAAFAPVEGKNRSVRLAVRLRDISEERLGEILDLLAPCCGLPR